MRLEILYRNQRTNQGDFAYFNFSIWEFFGIWFIRWNLITGIVYTIGIRFGNKIYEKRW